jgi:predicted transcriptional regulator
MVRETTLTIRLPDALRQRLDREASASDRPLNSVVVDFIQLGLRTREIAHEKDERERELKAIDKTGLVEPLGEGWEEYLVAARGIAHEEVRETLAGLSPFSVDIIAERNEER